jgi:hypothetical protein
VGHLLFSNVVNNYFLNSFAIIAADASAARSILVFKHDEDKVIKINFNFLCRLLNKIC